MRFSHDDAKMSTFVPALASNPHVAVAQSTSPAGWTAGQAQPLLACQETTYAAPKVAATVTLPSGFAWAKSARLTRTSMIVTPKF